MPDREYCILRAVWFWINAMSLKGNSTGTDGSRGWAELTVGTGTKCRGQASPTRWWTFGNQTLKTVKQVGSLWIYTFDGWVLWYLKSSKQSFSFKYAKSVVGNVGKEERVKTGTASWWPVSFKQRSDSLCSVCPKDGYKKLTIFLLVRQLQSLLAPDATQRAV